MTQKDEGSLRSQASGGVVETVVYWLKEYELRYPNGMVDTFTDIGDASDFRDRFFPDGVLFERSARETTEYFPWTEVES